jgi:hypothetical protein
VHGHAKSLDLRDRGYAGEQVTAMATLGRALGAARPLLSRNAVHVGVGAQHRAQPDVEGDAGLGRDLHLLDAGDALLDGVLDREDAALAVVELVQGGVERGRLAGAGRPGDEHGAVRPVDRAREALELGALHPERLEPVDGHVAALVEDAHDDALAVDERQRDDADVHAPAFDRQRETAVLGHAPLGDVEVGHDLDARDDAHRHPALDGRRRGEHAVDAEQHARVALLGVDVDVRGALLHGLRDDRVHELDHRRVAVDLIDGDFAFALLVGVLVDDVLDRVIQARQARGSA